MKLFGKIVLAAVAVTSVIAFSSCSQETPVAAYQYKDADGNTLVFYGDEKEGSFAVSTPELKFNDKNNLSRFPTTIYLLDAEGNRTELTEPSSNKTEVTVPSYALLKGKYTIADGESGKTLTLSEVKEFSMAADAWENELTDVFDEWETNKTADQLANDAKKNGYITTDADGNYIIKKTVVVSDYGVYGNPTIVTPDGDGNVVINIDSTGVISIGTDFDEVL